MYPQFDYLGNPSNGLNTGPGSVGSLLPPAVTPLAPTRGPVQANAAGPSGFMQNMGQAFGRAQQSGGRGLVPFMSAVSPSFHSGLMGKLGGAAGGGAALGGI